MVTKFEERFAKELLPLVRPADTIHPHPENPRKHADKELEAAIAKFGQMTPLTVQASTMAICKGNGTYAAMLRLGYENVAYHVVDMDDATALQYLHVDNRVSDLAAYDAKRTLAGLKALQDGPGLMGLWDQDALEDLEFQVNGVSATLAPEFKGGYAEGSDDHAARAATDKKPGQKMKEVPVVLTVEEHAAFMANLRAIAPALGTKGTIQTIVAAAAKLADELAGKGAALPPADANEVKVLLLTDLAAFFDDRGAESWSGTNIAVRLTKLADTFRPKPSEPKELPGQTHLSDHVAIPEAAGRIGEPLPNMVQPEELTPAGEPRVSPLREDEPEVPLAPGEEELVGDPEPVPTEAPPEDDPGVAHEPAVVGKLIAQDVPGGKPTTDRELFRF